ncbi:MAG: sigma-54 dependent transcriptional regulator [Deltaproteobacteria bacterium]|nr:sigma-54 dependent transcriptional regulator [Deltaproteobacteria bacterium]
MTDEEATQVGSILVVDDEVGALDGVRLNLRASGFANVVTCSDGREVPRLLRENNIELMLLDLLMPHMRGEVVLEQALALQPQLPVVVMTAEYDVRTAVRCMKLGAADYLTKPVDSELLVATVEKVLETSALRQEAAALRSSYFQQELKDPKAFESIITADPAMLRIFTYLEAASKGFQPVLISGETGTGKELMARALHESSGRKGPFVAVNVAGLDDEMFSDTLFGHVPGAFTGAVGTRKGMIEAAAAGTLFLDEIGDLSEASQVKLLRVLQEREYQPLGADVLKPMRARVVAATNRAASSLRSDLYYRLRSYHITIPPLRERAGDLRTLLDHFIRLAAEDLGIAVPACPPGLPELLDTYRFPGNIRELQAMVFHAVAQQRGGQLFLSAFEEAMDPGQRRTILPAQPAPPPARDHTDAMMTSPPREHDLILQPDDIERLERENIMRALEKTQWKVAGNQGAAALLGLRPSTLASKMKKMGIGRA